MVEKSDNCEIKRWDVLKRQLQNISPQETLQAIKGLGQPWVVIDCRRPAEYAQIRLPGAINIDYLGYDFWEKITELSTEESYLIYCNSCRRSTRVCTLMKNGGFTQVYNLDGGLNQWLNDLGDEGLERPA
ncbi:MAG: rhodanese-like domain-containing protein [Bacteroidetes bacterium]|nr:MAG: rhodanese-like domain-containing protein [Bacteroidota bacterium]